MYNKTKMVEKSANRFVDVKLKAVVTNELGQQRYFTYFARLFESGQLRIWNPAYRDHKHYFLAKVERVLLPNVNVTKFSRSDIAIAFSDKAVALQLPGYLMYRGDTVRTYVEFYPDGSEFSFSLTSIRFAVGETQIRFLVQDKFWNYFQDNVAKLRPHIWAEV